MFCIASNYQTKVEDLDQVVQIFNEKMIPLMAQQKGYRGIEVVAKPDTGEFMVLKFWDSEIDAKAWSNSGGHKQFGPQLSPLLIGNRTHNNYIVQTRVVK